MAVFLFILFLLAVLGCMVWAGLMLRTYGLRMAEIDRYPDAKRLADRLLLMGITYLLVGCLFVALAFATVGPSGWFIVNGLLLIAGSVELLLSMRIALRVAETDAGRQQRRLVGWMRLTGAALCFSPLLVIPVMQWLSSSVFGVLFTVASVHVAAAQRRMDQNTVLWALAAAGQSEAPLSDELYAVAQGLSGGRRRKTLKLVRLLNEGVPLDEALQHTRGVIPHFAVLAAQVGAQNGTLAKSLRIAATRHSGRDSSITTGASSPVLLSMYLVVVPLLAVFIVFGLMMWIVPKFKEIFFGFGSELPPLTNSVIEFSDWFSEYWYFLSPVLGLAFAAAIWLTVAYCRGWGENNIPLFGRLFRRLDVPDLLRNLAMTARSEQPLENSLSVLSRNHRRSAMRRTLQGVSGQVHEGQDCWAALQHAGLLRPEEAAVMECAVRMGNLPWALEQVAETIERRQRYRWLSVLEFVQPAIVTVIGVGIAIICLAFFIPVIQLINDLS